MRRALSCRSGWLAVAGVALLSAAPAWAAEEGKAGLPQLDTSTYEPQLVWLAITFIALYFVLSRIALPRIASVLDERERQMESDIERAEKLKAEAEEVLAAYERTMADARIKAQAEIGAASEAVAAEVAAREGELGAKIAARSEAAERAIAAAKQAAMADLQKVAAELAADMAAKLAGVKPGALAEAAVADVMRERR
jgi:F-type H+-transporting ATPase subunit b